jgi:signal transduction histidine kinase
MTTDATASPPIRQPAHPISRRQVDTILSRSTAVVSLVFALQTAPVYLAQAGESSGLWRTAVVIAFELTIVGVLITSFTRRHVRTGHALVTIVYLIALLTWPFAVTAPLEAGQNHWLYYLVTVATGNAVLAFPTVGAAVYTLVVPTLYGVLRVLPPNGAPLVLSALDVLYGVILGGGILLMIVTLRRAADAVDQAQALALDRYALAVRHDATEAERVQVDAIVHDGVLTTLLSAARAYTPEAKALAATMAGNAMGFLREAARAPVDGLADVSLNAVAQRIAHAADELGVPFDVEVRDPGTRTVPASAGEALVSAATQAMVNSRQHAGDTRRRLRVAPSDDGGIRIEVGDDGHGFALDDVPTERLGVRVSILERVALAGGSARIDSAPGAGTLVSIRWPREDHPAAADGTAATGVGATAPASAAATGGATVHGTGTR